MDTPDDLIAFIESNPDSRELKRAIAVQMVLNHFTHECITETIGVSTGFISKWTKRYRHSGIDGLRLGYRGSSGYLKPEQRAAVIAWLQRKSYWNLNALEHHIEQTYGLVFRSRQSYYRLFEEAGISWKKTQKCNPKADSVQVEKKKRTH
jgi:putative transposase